MIQGKIGGLKANQIKSLERIDRRRIPAGEIITQELARFLAEISSEIGRQIGLIVDRQGEIQHVIVGDDREIVIPDLGRYGLGRGGLRGLRCIHTHLKDEPLSRDDMTDLALLRLDMMIAIGVEKEAGRGVPARLHTAHLIPPNREGETIAEITYQHLHDCDLDFRSFVAALETEMDRSIDATVDTSDTREKAILISVSKDSRRQIKESMAELTELARTANVLVIDTVIQRPKQINPKFLMGQGLIKEVIISALQQRATLLIFDQDLTPTQVRSITEITEMKVLDRTQLILDIFARRAHTRDGKVQVELAQLKYILPRLSGKGSALSRLMGGIGGRGPGETKLEIDRRRTRDRITRLEKELKSMAKGRWQRRQKRIKAGVPIISIIGYTNAGKSTLLNSLTQSKTLTEDLLFATLDTATRRLRFPEDKEVIITDTVGFIRKLPKSLIGAFKATLEELEDADLLLHLVDVSNPAFTDHIDAVHAILEDLGLERTEELLVLNKTDKIEQDEIESICTRHHALPVSALDRKSFLPLLAEMERRFWPETTGQAANETVSDSLSNTTEQTVDEQTDISTDPADTSKDH